MSPLTVSYSLKSVSLKRPKTRWSSWAKSWVEVRPSSALVSRKCLLSVQQVSAIRYRMKTDCFAIAGEGGAPDTTFIEDAVHELLKTRRILKCSYPYGFFLEPKSTKKEIFELMQVKLYSFPLTLAYSYQNICNSNNQLVIIGLDKYKYNHFISVALLRLT